MLEEGVSSPVLYSNALEARRIFDSGPHRQPSEVLTYGFHWAELVQSATSRVALAAALVLSCVLEFLAVQIGWR